MDFQYRLMLRALLNNLLVLILFVHITESLEDSHLKYRRHSQQAQHRKGKDLSLWIDSEQIQLFSGIQMEIEVITNGLVLEYLLDPFFQDYLPTIPAKVENVNFTWRAGPDRYYYYNFDRLQSEDVTVLRHPGVSINRRGRIPQTQQSFTLSLTCNTNVTSSTVVPFTLGLLIETRNGKPLMGTPLRLKLKKECSSCTGSYCPANARLCYPKCINGGECGEHGICQCPMGFHGLHCEGGICAEKCLNGGKCIQKDTCSCSKGYYGHRCEYSKCMIACRNGGKCRGPNLCRCPPNYTGDHCEIKNVFKNNKSMISRHGPKRGRASVSCPTVCRNGECIERQGQANSCQCYDGWFGRRCNRRILTGRESNN